MPLAGGVVGASVTLLGVPETRRSGRSSTSSGTGETFDASSMALGLSYGRASPTASRSAGRSSSSRSGSGTRAPRASPSTSGRSSGPTFSAGSPSARSSPTSARTSALGGRDTRATIDPAPSQDGNNGQIPADYALDAWSIPLDFKLGVVARPVNSALNQLTVAVDALHPSTNYESLNVGAEYGFRERFFLRGGFQGLFLQDAEGGLSFGLGVHQPLPYPNGMAKLDVAVRDAGRLGRVQTIGLSLTF